MDVENLQDHHRSHARLFQFVSGQFIDEIQGDFSNWTSPENLSTLAPPKNASTGPPYFEKDLSMATEGEEIFQIL